MRIAMSNEDAWRSTTPGGKPARGAASPRVASPKTGTTAPTAQSTIPATPCDAWASAAPSTSKVCGEIDVLPAVRSACRIKSAKHSAQRTQ